MNNSFSYPDPNISGRRKSKDCIDDDDKNENNDNNFNGDDDVVVMMIVKSTTCLTKRNTEQMSCHNR